MKNKHFLIAAATILIALLVLAAPARAQDAKSDAIAKEIEQMTWLENTTVTLPDSHGRLIIPDDYAAIVGHDALRMLEITNGKPSNKKSEANVFSSDLKAQIDFDFIGTGYVSEDDWNTFDPKALLQSVIEATEEQNKERRAEGLPEMHAVKWLHQPTYNISNHTAFWAIQGTDSNGGGIVNSTALRLGRTGFERLVLIEDIKDYKPVGSPLDLMLASFSFSPGDTYEDHLNTDKIAGYGIAALVGTVVGAKVVKATAAGGLTPFFKQIAVFFAAVLGILLAPIIWLKSRFKRRKCAAGKAPLLSKNESTQN